MSAFEHFKDLPNYLTKNTDSTRSCIIEERTLVISALSLFDLLYPLAKSLEFYNMYTTYNVTR